MWFNCGPCVWAWIKLKIWCGEHEVSSIVSTWHYNGSMSWRELLPCQSHRVTWQLPTTENRRRSVLYCSDHLHSHAGTPFNSNLLLANNISFFDFPFLSLKKRKYFLSFSLFWLRLFSSFKHTDYCINEIFFLIIVHNSK